MPKKLLASMFAFLLLAFGTMACEGGVEAEGGEEGGGVGVEVEED